MQIGRGKRQNARTKLGVALFVSLLWMVLSLVICGSLVAEEAPPWVVAGIVDHQKYILVPGKSGPRASEQEARYEAMRDATEAFRKVCGVDEATFDRAVEAYSEQPIKTMGLKVAVREGTRTRALGRITSVEKWHVVPPEDPKGSFEAFVLVKVPKTEVLRIAGMKNVQLAVDVGFFVERKRGELAPFEQGAELRSGDGFAIYLRPSDDCFVYIFQVDATGASFRLFPNPDFGTSMNPVRRAADLWIPNLDNLLVLDQTVGKERIYLFASKRRISELEVSAAPEGGSLVKTIETMGVAGTRMKQNPGSVPPPMSGFGPAEIKKMLQGTGAIAYETWFVHR